MRVKRLLIVSLVLAAAMTGFAFYAAARVPPGTELPVHWNAAGEVNGTLPALNALLFPVIGVIVSTVVFSLIPRLEPLQNRLEGSADVLRTTWIGLLFIMAMFEAAVAALLEPGAEVVGLGVGDAHLPDAEAVEHVEPVDLVLDRGRRLQREDVRDPDQIMPALRRACGVDDDDLKEMIAELRGLTPRPGAAFGGEPAAPVVPDVFVREGEGGLWRVELNTDTLPRLLVDQRYHAVVSGQSRTEQEKVFVSDCMAQASWLIRSLDQRAKTILKVASEIVRQQDGFLAFGVEHLRPLNLKTVADAIAMHESTVSRVTSNKYLATPRGVFEMKFFFTSAIASSEGGEAHSAESVRHRIKQLIDAEHSEAEVHSDDNIVDILKEAGVDIARRTVAKYREAMRIPSSVERRRLLRAAV